MKTKIIVDSTADLIPAVKCRVEVVPLTVYFGEKGYLDGVGMDHHEFYTMLERSSELPKTAQATPEDFRRVLDGLTEGEGALIITLSQKLSGTYQSALMAAQGRDEVFVVDCGSTAVGGGALTEYALRLLDEGKGAAEIAELLERKKGNLCLIAKVDTLEYLRRGGRLSRTAAIAGGILNVKPVLTLTDGELTPIGRVRGDARAGALVAEKIASFGGIDPTMPYLVGYAGLSDEPALRFIKEHGDIFPDGKAEVTCIGSVIGTHAGPGTVAVAFFVP